MRVCARAQRTHRSSARVASSIGASSLLKSMATLVRSSHSTAECAALLALLGCKDPSASSRQSRISSALGIAPWQRRWQAANRSSTVMLLLCLSGLMFCRRCHHHCQLAANVPHCVHNTVYHCGAGVHAYLHRACNKNATMDWHQTIAPKQAGWAAARAARLRLMRQ